MNQKKLVEELVKPHIPSSYFVCECRICKYYKIKQKLVKQEEGD